MTITESTTSMEAMMETTVAIAMMKAGAAAVTMMEAWTAEVTAAEVTATKAATAKTTAVTATTHMRERGCCEEKDRRCEPCEKMFHVCSLVPQNATFTIITHPT